MKKNIKVSFLLFISLVVIMSIAFTVYINFYKIIKDYMNFYSEDTPNMLYIRMKDEEATEYFSDFINSIQQVDNIVLKVLGLDIDLDYPINNTIGLYYNGEYNYNFNILEGHFFSKNEIDSNEKLVVIGKEVLDKCIEENGEKYLIKEEEKVRVIGVIGEENNKSEYDSYVFYNMKAFYNEIREIYYGDWRIDSYVYDSSELYSIIKNCQDVERMKGYRYEDEMSALDISLMRTLKDNRDMLISFVLIIITAILGIIQSILYWVNNLKVEVGIKKAYGASNKNIIINIIKRFYIIESIATITAIGIIFIVSRINNFNIFYFEINIIIISALIILMILLGIIPYKAIKNILKNNSIIALIKEGTI